MSKKRVARKRRELAAWFDPNRVDKRPKVPPPPQTGRKGPANPVPKRYGGRYLVGFGGVSFPKPRIRKAKKR